MGARGVRNNFEKGSATLSKKEQLREEGNEGERLRKRTGAREIDVCVLQRDTKGGDSTVGSSAGTPFPLHNEIREEFASSLYMDVLFFLIMMMNGVCQGTAYVGSVCVCEVQMQFP